MALAPLRDRRIVRRFTPLQEQEVQALAGSPDGRALYYVASGMVWRVAWTSMTGGASALVFCADVRTGFERPRR